MMNKPNRDPLLAARHLVKEYTSRASLLNRRKSVTRAVDDVSFRLFSGETYGLAGESGSGKSTLARLVMNLIIPTSGEVVFAGKKIAPLEGKDLLELRRSMQIIAQDPRRALNPKHSILQILSLPFRVHTQKNQEEIREEAGWLLADVGLSPAEAFFNRYPHQLSGGQCQRVAFARAIALSPQLVVADEAVSALDVSIRAQILSLMKKLQVEHDLTYLLIAHDLAVLRSVADRVAIMYLGKIVEEAPREMLYAEPLHPYTMALLAATPAADPAQRQKRKERREAEIKDDDILSEGVPSGCRFHPRCPLAMAECRIIEPPLIEVRPNHRVACHLHPKAITTGNRQS